MPIKKAAEGDFESELNKGALWAVTYGDLMSYLMIFFLIMFAFSMGKKGPGFESKKVDEALASVSVQFHGKVSEARQHRMEARQKEEAAQQKLEEEAAQSAGAMKIDANEERTKITLKDAVLFDSGFADLKDAATPALESILPQIVQATKEVVVEGHTDNVPMGRSKYRSNYELSMARAYAVIEFFIKHGVDPKRLSGSGYGEYRPIADNSTPEGRAKNRRIEIDLLRTR
ncbi:MAG: flagellar motor protein MotB [Elusimicrobia bacterium]|nr:flagellar motor protein MotB [Elusimicrobiota bacterium]